MKASGGHKTQKDGFAIVELLVVIAIITILVGVILPAAIQSRNRSRSISCVSNLKQLSAGILLYAQDWSDRLPRLEGNAFAGSYPLALLPEGTSASHLRAVLIPRVVSQKLYRCPNDTGASEYGFDPQEGPVFTRTGTSYVSWSTARAGRFGVSINGGFLNQSRVGAAVRLLTDYGSDWHGIRVRDGLSIFSSSSVNAAFADGRASRVAVYAFATGSGSYSGTTGLAPASSGPIHLAGSTNFGSIEMNGHYYGHEPGGPGGGELKVCLSGEVITGDGYYEVDKTFTFGAGVGMPYVMRQIAMSVEGQYGR